MIVATLFDHSETQETMLGYASKETSLHSTCHARGVHVDKDDTDANQFS